MAELSKPSELLQCKTHTDCRTRARVITWDCGCVEVHYIASQGHATYCEDFAGMARKLDHEHDQKPVLVKLRTMLREQHQRILASNQQWRPHPTYRGVRAGYRPDASEDLSSVRPIRTEDYVEIVQPR